MGCIKAGVGEYSERGTRIHKSHALSIELNEIVFICHDFILILIIPTIFTNFSFYY